MLKCMEKTPLTWPAERLAINKLASPEPVRRISALHVHTSLTAPASPSSLDTCICGWRAASGQVAEMWGYPCQQGEPPSCHHKMPPGGNNDLASPAGVWKRQKVRKIYAVCRFQGPCAQPPVCLVVSDSALGASDSTGLSASIMHICIFQCIQGT